MSILAPIFALVIGLPHSHPFILTPARTITLASPVHHSTTSLFGRKRSITRDDDKAIYPFNADLEKKKTVTPTPTNLQKRDDPEWEFFDTARLHVSGGDGGKGCVAFRREKSEARGGPNGGRGGRGGNIFLFCDKNYNTLSGIRHKVHVRAGKGRNGMGKARDGKHAGDMYVYVPPGTLVREMLTKKVAGELREHGEVLLVARGGRGGRGNGAFMTARYTAPKIAEKGEPGAARWLSLELRLVADVGFLGKPNAGKSTLLSVASAARPKIADYPFTTIVPNLGVCDFQDEGQGGGLVMCDIPGVIEGAAGGAGLGHAFLRHVQRCKVLLHVVDGTSEDPIGDFNTINQELKKYDPFLAEKPQVVVLNKLDVPEVQEREAELLQQLKLAAGHTRVLPISAATTLNVRELMGRIKKFADVQPEPDLPPPPEVNFSSAGLEMDSDDFTILSDPAYPNQFRVSGRYIEQVAKMTHWEYPEAISRFGRQLEAMGISYELERRGATDGDLVMVDKYDFDFAPSMTNPYIPEELLERDAFYQAEAQGKTLVVAQEEDENEDEDLEELSGFEEEDDWDLLDFDDNDELIMEADDEVWSS